jgi:quinoprotein glucose dehydrogenase
MSCDPELGYVYLPFGTATNDWYGGHRKGANLFSESLVCLDARTGKRVWHFQMVHHGLWDYDLPCAPNLLDVTVDGKPVKAIAQVTKQAFCFVFDRVTGKPLWPIEERPVPPTKMPGDRAWPTQPFPTKPAPFDRQGGTVDNLIDFTPELRKEAEAILETWEHGPLYTPPAGRRTILMPGWVGGASWAGAAADPETGILYVPSITNAMWLALAKPAHWLADVDFKIGDNGHIVEGPRGLPLFKPPYGRITAIDLNTGDHRWMTPLGDGPRDHPALKGLNLPPLGRNRRGYVVVTKTLLLTVQEGSWFATEAPQEPAKLRAFDKATGRLLGEVDLPAHATGAPITYMTGGKQYFVFPVGGSIYPQELVALALP